MANKDDNKKNMSNGKEENTLDASSKKKSKKKDEIGILLEELENKKNAHLRLMADFENYKKRNRLISQEMYQEGKYDVIKELLYVLDSFDRANSMCKDKEYLDGISSIHKQLLNILTKFNVEEIEAKGKVFDAKYHNAIHQIKVEGVESGIITDVAIKGYKIGDVILRHADVVVAE